MRGVRLHLTKVETPDMSQAPITFAGIPIPSDAPAFLAVLAIHVVAGLTCVLTGLVAMLSLKGSGRHPRFGTLYYWNLAVVFASMTVLSAMRWAEDYHLFILGILSFAAATVGRQFAPNRTAGHARAHVIGMGLSYILLLTAFYVDNGPHLPLWRNLHPMTYWLLPVVVGGPIILRVLLRHPIVLADRRGARTRGAA
jgi:hypothetical protein